MNNIIRNIMRTPDGTLLESMTVHDYVDYVDTNGEKYILDGGNQYLRTSKNTEPAEYLTVTTKDNFLVIRDNMFWGTFGKAPDYIERSYVTLSCLSNAHIEAILETQKQLPEWRRELFKKELAHRGVEDVFIEEVPSYREANTTGSLTIT